MSSFALICSSVVKKVDKRLSGVEVRLLALRSRSAYRPTLEDRRGRSLRFRIRNVEFTICLSFEMSCFFSPRNDGLSGCLSLLLFSSSNDEVLIFFSRPGDFDDLLLDGDFESVGSERRRSLALLEEAGDLDAIGEATSFDRRRDLRQDSSLLAR